MIVEGKFKFEKQWPEIIFQDIDVDVNPVVSEVNPTDMTINVSLTFTVEGNAQGRFAPDINPVPVFDLNYDYTQLAERIVDRLKDFQVTE